MRQTHSVQIVTLQPHPRACINGRELDWARDRTQSVLLAVDLYKGRISLERLTAKQAVDLCGIDDPYLFWTANALSAQQRGEVEAGRVSLKSLVEARYRLTELANNVA